MYYYAPDNNRTGRRAGLIAAACYLATFLAVSLFVSFRTEYERPAEGILIDFGDDSDGSGTQNVALSETEEAPIGTQIRPSFRPDTAKIPKQEGEEPTESGRPSGIWPVRQDSGHASVPAPPNYDGRFAAAACPLHKAASRSSTCTMEASFNITHRSPSSR